MHTQFRFSSGRAILGIISSALLFASIGFQAKAALFSTNYGNFAGSTVTFENVSESSITETNALFQMPYVSVNTLGFNPQGFGAFAQFGGADFTDGQLNLTMKSMASHHIQQINFAEQGDFSLFGLGTANTFVDVSASFFITVKKVDGNAIVPFTVTSSMTFAPLPSGTFNLPTYPGGGQLWSGTFNFDVNAALISHSIPFLNGATEIDVALDNTLYAFSEPNTVAFITKKHFDGLGITVYDPAVPEPATAALTLIGTAFVLRRRR